MDDFIIRKLESVFDRFFISPYFVARNFILFSMLWWIYVHKLAINSYKPLVLLNLTTLLVISFILYNKTKTPELGNRKLFANFLRYRNRTTRLISLFFVFFCGIISYLYRGVFIEIFIEILVWTIYQYLVCLEWNGVLKDTRWVGLRIVGKTKTHNKLRRKQYWDDL